jgi:hypothetical protein
MLNVTLLAVKYAALLLIERNEATTTLEVKNLLRELNYYAEQDEISHFMNEAAQELPLEFVPGPYRSYKLPDVSSLSTDADDEDDDDDDIFAVTTAVATGVVPDDESDLHDDLGGVSQALNDVADVKYTSRFGELVLLYDDPATIVDAGGKVTRLSTGAGRSFYYAQTIRRDLARSAHASTVGTHKNNTLSTTQVA